MVWSRWFGIGRGVLEGVRGNCKLRLRLEVWGWKIIDELKGRFWNRVKINFGGGGGIKIRSWGREEDSNL